MEELTADQGGCWRVDTEASTYLIDLDQRRFMRCPGTTPTHVTDTGDVVVAFRFPDDHRWLPLLELTTCRIGAPLTLTARGADGKPQNYTSTLVQRIQPIDDPRR